VVVLGGGFGGLYTAVHLERLAAKGAPIEVSLVNRENYLVFQPMLAEVIAGDVGILDTVSPLRQLLTRTDLFVREIEGVDLDRRVVTLGAGLTPARRSSSRSSTRSPLSDAARAAAGEGERSSGAEGR
jgi:NADH:ubiquinone reductase (H+-translocating)